MWNLWCLFWACPKFVFAPELQEFARQINNICIIVTCKEKSLKWRGVKKSFAMNWIAYPPNLYVDAPTPNSMVLKEALWEIIRFRWGQECGIYEGNQCLIRRDSSELMHSLCLEQPASWAVCKPGSKPHHVSSLILDLKPPQPWEN